MMLAQIILRPGRRRKLPTFSQLISLTARYASSSEGGELLQNIYRQMANDTEIKEDIQQLRALKSLDRLYTQLQNTAATQNDGETNEENKSSSFWSFLGKTAAQPPVDPSSPKGVYLHGGVGCGKTFCMNLFYDNLENGDKQHVHFHKFMLQVHNQMHEAKRIEGVQGDVLPRVVERTLERGNVICFDEFQVTDVADALILQRLFTSLLEKGAVIVATSNRPPEDLYLGGLQRDRFLPFIDLLHEKLDVVSMWDSEVDYRIIQGDHKAKGVYFVGKQSRRDFDVVFHSLTKGGPVVSTNLTTQGRMVPIPRASLQTGVARFTFEDLCTKALGAADYLVIGQHFHTVFVDRIPQLNRQQINWVRRFIVFVDNMYESNVKLILQAATQPEGIFEVDLEDQATDEAFAFDRTRSRLEEMRSESYLQRRWSGKADSPRPELKLRMEPSLSENHAIQ